MDPIRLPIKIILQDAAIIGTYWVLACGVDKLGPGVPDWLGMGLMLALWAGLLLFLFFSHGELFRSVRNDYAWSIATGLLTLAVMIPVVMGSVHNPCPWAGAT